MELKIKPQYGGRYIAFGGTGKKALKDRTQDELRQLAIIAQQSKDKTLLELFESKLPGLSDLQINKVKDEVAKVKTTTKPTEAKK